MKCQALMDDVKQGSSDVLRFFPDENNFTEDRNVSQCNERWICQDSPEVTTVMHTKVSSSVMVLGGMGSK